MAFAVTATIVGGAALGYEIYSGERAYREQKKAQKDQLKQQRKNAAQAERAFNAQNQKRPSIANAATMGNPGKVGSTMLTGPTGVDSSQLRLGKTSLLGA